MPHFVQGLARVGRVFHYHFTQDGRSYGGSTRCESPQAARAWLRAYRDHLALEAVGAKTPRAPGMTLCRLLDDWTKAQAGSSGVRHVANVRSSILHHLKPLLGLPLTRITTQAVEDARAAYLACQGTGRRPGQEGTWRLAHTVGGANKVVQNLSSVLGWAVRRGVLLAMPFRLGRLKAQEEVKVVLWPENVQPFLAEADKGHKRKHHHVPHSATAMRLMLQLGLREDEALNARWEWLDRRRQVYQVGQAKNRRVREIPIPDSLMDHLDRVLGPTTEAPRGLILVADDGGAHRAGFTAKPVERCATQVGAPGLHPHRLRASFATTHFEAGTPLSQIQQMMGHEDPETTRRYIVQRSKGQVEAQARVAVAMGFRAEG